MIFMGTVELIWFYQIFTYIHRQKIKLQKPEYLCQSIQD